MRHVFLVLTIALIAISLAFASSVKRIDKRNGSFAGRVNELDSVTVVTDRIPLSQLGQSGNLNYDQVIVGITIPDFVQVSTVAGEAAVDSCKVRLMGGTDTNVDTIMTVTKAALPATFTFTTSMDSIGIYRHQLLNDNLWFSVWMFDSAGSGSGDTLTYAVTWWAKLLGRD